MSAGTLLRYWRSRLDGDSRAAVRVLLPEGQDPRVRKAANRLLGHGVVPVLVTDDEPPGAVPLLPGVEATTTPALASGASGRRVRELAQRRQWDGARTAQAMSSPVCLAAAALAAGVVDACVAGSTQTSADVIRAALRLVGLDERSPILSSSFLMMLPDERVVCFADCAVVPEPDEVQLAEIAVTSAHTLRALTGAEPAVAMLSFSTKGSVDHESVRRVRSATELVRLREPGLVVDGELQFDAAVARTVARRKGVGSPVAGRANVFVFPNLAAGNIGYKIAQRLGGARAFGPILQGLRKPMNDLSRGCSVQDIVNVALISALQARAADRPAESASAPLRVSGTWRE